MFRSTTIIRELVLNLAKVIFMLKHVCYVLCVVLCTAHNTHAAL